MFITYSNMDVTKPYEFIGFGAMAVTKPYEFTGFGKKRQGQWMFMGMGNPGVPRTRPVVATPGHGQTATPMQSPNPMNL